MKKKLLIISNTDWFIFNFKKDLIVELSKEYIIYIIVKRYCGYRVEGVDITYVCERSMGLIRFILTIISIVSRYKPKAILNFTIKPVLLGSAVACLFGNVIINNITGMGHIYTTRGVRNSVLKYFVEMAHRVISWRGWGTRYIFENQDDLDYFVAKKLIRVESANLIEGSGVDLNEFKPTRRKKENVVLMAGRFLKEKGVLEYIEAASIVSKKNPDVKFLLAGEEDKGNPSSLTKEYLSRIATDVAILGHVKDIRCVMSKVKICVLPSYREGCSRFIQESMACGLPIVTTKAIGCKQCVEDGKNGYLVEIGNVSQLADRICEILADPILAKRMGNASREMAEGRFSIRKNILDNKYVLQRVLGE